jgi:hypothetical protein
MASNDPAVPAVEHTEGTSYVVAFGDPARYVLPNPDNYHNCRDFPAAGGDNPYQPEMGLMASLVEHLPPLSAAPAEGLHTVVRIANALSVTFYDALRCAHEQSRGFDLRAILSIMVSNRELKPFLDWMLQYDHLPGGPGGCLYAILTVCFYRMCYRDGTVQAFAETPDLATTSDSTHSDLLNLYFNLSARERTRLREYSKSVRRERRMPSILARQLIISKVDKRKLHGQLRRLVYGLFMTESDELFRVVVSFL